MYKQDTIITVIQPTEIEIHILPPSKITSQLLLSLAANSQKVTFLRFFRVSNYIILRLMYYT
jgi:hypothetical protein